MSLLDILLKAGGAAGQLVALLNKAKGQVPDLAVEVDKVLASMVEAVDPQNLIALAESLPKDEKTSA